MDYTYSYDTVAMESVVASGLLGSFFTVYILILLAITVLSIIAQWKLFEKAGVDGWKSLIPFYNSYCLCDIAMGNGILFLLYLVPCINLVFSVMLCLNIAKAYGKGVGFGILTIFFQPIMLMILAFSDAQYIGPQK